MEGASAAEKVSNVGKLRHDNVIFRSLDIDQHDLQRSYPILIYSQYLYFASVQFLRGLGSETAAVS